MKRFRLICFMLLAGLILTMPASLKWVSLFPKPILDCPAQAETIGSLSAAQAICGLGRRWEVNEGCWRGVYIRRGNSNVFDAEWTLLDGRQFTAEVTIDIQGNRVVAQRRRATLGGNCDLMNGTLSADGVTVTGSYECSHPEGQASGCFFARIICDNQSGPVSRCGLGNSWGEEESGWSSVWTRRGSSNVFDASYTNPDGRRASTVNAITIEGNRVSIRRTSSSDGNLCTYEGTIQSDGVTITGTYTCPSGHSSSWRAKINCGGIR